MFGWLHFTLFSPTLTLVGWKVKVLALRKEFSANAGCKHKCILAGANVIQNVFDFCCDQQHSLKLPLSSHDLYTNHLLVDPKVFVDLLILFNSLL